MDIHQAYYSDAILVCNETPIQNRTQNSEYIDTNIYKTLTNQVWLLPNGNVISNTNASGREWRVQVSMQLSRSVLMIHRIDDVDFGIYWCIQVWNDSSIDATKHSLNIDGPPMHAFYDRQKNNVIVGVAAAGVVLSVIVLVYIVWYFRCSERVQRKKRLSGDLAKGVNRYSTEIYDNVGMELYIKKTNI